MSLPPVAQRFLRYVRIDTTSDPASDAVPSTERQKDLGRLLVRELREIGVEDAEMDAAGYVYATLPSTLPAERAARTPVVGLVAHVDTSPDAPGAGVSPVVHPNYDGGVLELAPGVRLDPDRQPALRDHVGHDLITSDGTTLLGSDDKAGVAVIMQLAEDLVRDDAPRPTLRLLFTVDEEIGRGVDALDLARFGADVAYTLDGSGTDALYAETFNAAEAVLTVEGVGVHPGYAKGTMVNAARVAAEFVAALPAAEAPETTEGREGYYHPHTITASDVSRAGVRILLRDFEHAGLLRREAYLEHLVALLRARHPGVRLTLDVHESYRNMRSYIEAVDPRAVTFALAAGEASGRPLRQEIIRGGTDGARLSERGIPTPNVFNGGHDYHSVFEWNTVQNLEASLSYTHALVRYWGEHGDEAERGGTG